MSLKAAWLSPKDNTAVALVDLAGEDEIALQSDGASVSVRPVEPITYQHKFAVRDIRQGEQILKYGEVIGEATRTIKAGEHVHVHNMVGLRAKARK